MSRPMTRLMTTAVATKPATEPGRRWGLRPSPSSTPAHLAQRDGDVTDGQESAPFWEYYCLAFC